jgi:AraC-like DNA-binding protein
VSKYENHNLETNELPFIYNERIIKPKNELFDTPNWHENIEILYIVNGEGAISNNGTVFSVCAGDIAVINHNNLHAISARDKSMLHRYLIVDRSFCISNGIDTNSLLFETEISDSRVRDLMEQLHTAYTSDKASPTRILSIRSLVLQILVLLCTCHAAPSKPSEKTEKSVAYVKTAISYIHASYAENFSLDDVAAFVGINKCYLSREFHKYTGLPFVAYVNRTRCNMAKQLLLDERLSIAEIGSRCGFENRSYFAKSFRKYVGMLPGEYRAKKLTR